MDGATITRTLKLITYNIHSYVGRDGQVDTSRVRQVLDEEQPDIAALQEVEWKLSGPDAFPTTGSYCQTRPAAAGAFGLATLSPLRVLACERYDLSFGSEREARYCLRTDLEVEAGAVLHVFNCHLGLAVRERRFQRDRLLSEAILLAKDLHHPVVLMGDFNDSPWPVVHPGLRRHFRDAFRAAGKRWGPTFRVGPLALRLDRIYVSRGIRVADCRVRNDALTRVASDHLPVLATVEIDWR